MAGAHGGASFGLHLLLIKMKATPALKLRRPRLITLLVAPYRALLGTARRILCLFAGRTRSSKMTSDDIETVVRAMMLTVDSLDVGPVKRAMQEASTLVLAHALAERGLCRDETESLQRAPPDQPYSAT